MKDEELLEWYKNNNTTRPTDMSDKDYELYMNRANKLQQDRILQQNLQNQQAAIAKVQSNAQQSASISNEKLMQYLNQSHLASGVAKGQTNSDFINANNSYMTNRASIANNAAEQQKELLNNYASDKLANEQNAHNNQIEILDKYKQQDIEAEERAKDNELWQLEIDAAKQELQNVIADEKSTTEEKLKAEQESEDMDWLTLAMSGIESLIKTDEDGELTASSLLEIEAALENYRTKFNNDRYYNYLVEMVNTAKRTGTLYSAGLHGYSG